MKRLLSFLFVLAMPLMLFANPIEVTVTGLEWDENTNAQYIHNKLDIVIHVKNVGKTVFNNRILGYMEVYQKDDNGNIADNYEEGLPTWCWNSVKYLRLEPNESTTLSFSIGRETLKPNDYLYSIAIFYYNNQMQLLSLYSNGYYYYVDDTEGITHTTQQSSSDPYYYDLQGRRVNQDSLQPGIYIHHNKKMIVK